jgi:hypothetical protein
MVESCLLAHPTNVHSAAMATLSSLQRQSISLAQCRKCAPVLLRGCVAQAACRTAIESRGWGIACCVDCLCKRWQTLKQDLPCICWLQSARTAGTRLWLNGTKESVQSSNATASESSCRCPRYYPTVSSWQVSRGTVSSGDDVVPRCA